MVRNLLFMAVTAAAVIFSGANLAGGEYAAAGAAALVGLAWLAAEVLAKPAFSSLFFGVMVGAAALGGLKHLPAPLLLLGLAAALAAWDLSRFRARVRRASAGGVRAEVARRHLLRLGATLGIGYAAALIPLLFHLPLTFAGIFGLGLLLVLALRRALLGLRRP